MEPRTIDMEWTHDVAELAASTAPGGDHFGLRSDARPARRYPATPRVGVERSSSDVDDESAAHSYASTGRPSLA